MSNEEQSNIVEYCNNLEGTLSAKEDQLADLKTTIASFEKRFADQHKEMQADRKEFMQMMKNMANNGITNNQGGGGGDEKAAPPVREKARNGKGVYCKNCKLEDQWHRPFKCWELEANKAFRPPGWQSVLK